MGHFINGLKEEITAEVRLLHPVSLEHAMETAVRVEEKHRVTRAPKLNLSTIKTGSFTYSKGTSVQAPYSIVPPSSPMPSRTWSSAASQTSVQSPTSPATKTVGEVRRLTDKELQEKRAKGLCYRCDDKWVQGHRCKRKELSVMLIDEEEDAEIEAGEAVNNPVEEFPAEVSLNSVVGLSNPKTMKVKGLIGDMMVVVMIDPGATHNFISKNAVKTGGVVVTPSGSFGVSLGNGEAIKGDGVCKDVRLQLDGGIELLEDFLPLELGSSDVILGIQWLEKLGMVTTNWKTQVMKFELGGELVTLIGDQTLVHSQVSLKAMLKALRKQGQEYWVECNRLEQINGQGEGVNSGVPSFLQPVVQLHSRVFDTPVGLPPSRGHEHAINMKEGSSPVSMRPYRYPYCQKDEIERLIAEMLAAGIIKPSTSPYSSPVLLVKKKDGSCPRLKQGHRTGQVPHSGYRRVAR
ncbi:uncharacterized protein LOC135152943 [Daucus carota subsp. sativus]|uniref:uncharacterized protein LOC135152943 n=1 Tax=Daucus carota subsp. sativus TaxID=79200 RepID=UPI0030834AE4